MRVSFDFDDTLLQLGFNVEEMEFYELGPNEKILTKMREHIKHGDDVFVVTSRQWTQASQDEIEDLLANAGVLHHVQDIVHTGEYKAPTLKKMRIDMHYDDSPYELSLLPAEIRGVLVGTVHGLED